MENSEVSTKKKGKVGVVLLVIVLMALCLGGGFYVGDIGLISLNKKETKCDSKKEKKEESDELKSVDVDEYMTMLFGKLETADICGLTKYETFYKNEKVTVGALSKKEVQLILVNQLSKRGFVFAENNSFTSEEAHDIIKNVFGKEYNYDDESIKDYCPDITYDSQNKKYVVGKAACGGSCGPHTVDKILSAKKNSDTIELTVGVLFGSKDHDGKLYSDYERTNVISQDGNYADSDFDKGSKYKVTFKKEDGNYVFVSSEPVK